jgi:hypothetical protein
MSFNLSAIAVRICAAPPPEVRQVFHEIEVLSSVVDWPQAAL